MVTGVKFHILFDQFLRVEGQVETEKSVFLKLFKNGLSNLAEIFTTYQAKVCDDLTQKF